MLIRGVNLEYNEAKELIKNLSTKKELKEFIWNIEFINLLNELILEEIISTL